MPHANKKRPHEQTVEEWIADYDNWVAQHPGCGTESSWEFTTRRKLQQDYAEPSDLQNKKEETSTHLFQYLDHRTTRMSTVVLIYKKIDSSMTAVKFFNVSLKSSRGNYYPAGNRGQFIPPIKGEFRRFWMQSVGEPPSRWCRVHKSMRSSLSSFIFVGEVVESRDSKGIVYNKITSLRKQSSE